MFIKIFYDGNEFTSKSDKSTACQTADMLYDNLSTADKFQLELADGGHLIMGEEAIRRAVIITYDDENTPSE